jgi:hypothetical protein
MMRLRHIGCTLLASVFVIAIAVDSADARRGGGGGGRGGGGFSRGGGGGSFSGARVGGGGRAHVSHPIAGGGRGPRPSHPIAGVRPGGGHRPGGPGWAGNRPGWGYPGYGWGVGAAAVGAAAWASTDCYYWGTCGGSYGGDYYYQPAESDAIEACARRFKTYDRASQTYVAKGGRRVSCP